MVTTSVVLWPSSSGNGTRAEPVAEPVATQHTHKLTQMLAKTRPENDRLQHNIFRAVIPA